MKNSLKVLFAAGTLAASIPVALAQSAPPPPPPPPPAAMAPGGGGAGGGGGRGGAGGFQAPPALAPADLAIVNKALKDLISKSDPDAKKVIDANPTWNPIAAGFGGGRGGFGGGAGGAGGGGGRRGGGGAGGAGGGAPAQ